MASPVGETFLPKLFIHTFTLLGFITTTIFSLFSFLDFSHFLKPEPNFQENLTQIPISPPASAALIRELLPVIKFCDLPSSFGAVEGCPPESCPVCLYEFEGGEDIRCLMNCKHIYHKSCLDSWLDYDQETCPVCRKHLVPRELQKEFRERLWAAFCIENDIDYCE